MSEVSPEHEYDYEPMLDRENILASMQQLGIEIDQEEFEDRDDNEVLGVIAAYAAMYDFDIDDVLCTVAPVDERYDKEDDDEV